MSEASSNVNPAPIPALTIDRTVEIINEFCDAFPVAYAIEFKVRATQEELYGPQASPDRVGLIKAAFIPATAADQASRPDFRGRADIAYANARDEDDLRRSLYHEIAGHFGLNTSSSPAAKRSVLESIILSRAQPGIAELWDRVEKSYPDSTPLVQAEEVYCSLAENLERFPSLLVDKPQALEKVETQGPQILELHELQDIVVHVATGLHLGTRDQQVFPQSPSTQFSRSASTSTEPKVPYHEVVASELIRQIEAGTSPWQKPWSADGVLMGLPTNPVTQQRYRGINTIHLISQGYSDPRWMTYKQAQSLGAQVRKGEKGTSIQFWKFEDLQDKKDEAGRPIRGADGQVEQIRVKLERPRVFYATVFNAEQIDGLPPHVQAERTWNPVERAESMLSASGAQIVHSAIDRAYYSLNTDVIHLPLQSQFGSPGAYYATALHELGHWSGHDTRLNRDLKHPFGSEGYAREELRAEIASMLLTAEIGIPHDPQQHASYVASWVDVLKKDPLEIFRAAADAEKIHAFVMGLAPTVEVAPPQQDRAPQTQLASIDPTAPQEQPTMATRAPKPSSEIILLTLDEVRDALSFISPNMPRDDWARVAMAIKSEFPDEGGLAAFDAWSATGENYDARAVDATWKSIKAGGGVTLGTLVKLAKDNGYERRLDEEQRAQRLQALANEPPRPRIDHEAEAAQILAAQQNTATTAQSLWANAREQGSSPYLQRKQVNAHGVRFTDQGTVLVPLVDETGKLWNVQRILPKPLADGNDKLYLKDGRKSGLSHMLGTIDPANPTPIGFAEGYSTAASLHEATGWPVVMTMDSGNLPKIVAQYRQRFPEQLLVIGADDDQATMLKEGYNPGVLKATEAAKASGALVLMPSERKGLNTDFNDVWVVQGGQASPEMRESIAQQLQQRLSGPISDGQRAQIERAVASLASPQANGEKPTAEINKQNLAITLPEPPPEVSAQTLEAGVSAASPVKPSDVSQQAPAQAVEQVQAALPPKTPEATLTPIEQQAEPASSTTPWTELNMGPVEAQRERDRAAALNAMTGPRDQANAEPVGQPMPNSVQGQAISPEQDALKGGDSTPAVDALAALRAELAKAYQFDGVGKYYFRGTSAIDLAFEDTGETFNTRHHSAEVTSSIARLAKAKGWEQITIRGEPEFLREMWLQASLAGLKVKGYSPEPIDLQRLQERQALLQKDAQAQGLSKVPSTAKTDTGKDAPPQSATDAQGSVSSEAVDIPKAVAPIYLSKVASQQLDGQIRSVLARMGAKDPQAIEGTLAALYEQVQSSRVYVGEIVKQGVAPYQFKDKERASPYVTLKTATGEQTVWGVDLPRALENTRVGQEVVLAYQGAKSVSVPVENRDEQGRLLGTQWETVERNTWNAQSIQETYDRVSKTPELMGQPLEQVASPESRNDLNVKPATEAPPMQALPSAQERLRRALAKQGAQPLDAEITISAMSALLDSPKFYVGQLLGHGQDPSRASDPLAPASHFVRLGTDEGTVVVWSDALPKALEASEVQTGQNVVVAYKGLEVTRNDQGVLETRNSWLVESLPELHAQSLDGVKPKSADLTPMSAPPLQAQALNTPQEQLLYIFQSALSQAGIPQSLAMETLAKAEQTLAGTPSPMNRGVHMSTSMTGNAMNANSGTSMNQSAAAMANAPVTPVIPVAAPVAAPQPAPAPRPSM